jgi:hypothetical protein
MTTGEAQPMTEEQFRSLMTKLEGASSGLTEREKSYVVEAFKEGVATADEGDVQGYVQIVEATVGEVTPVADTLSPEERQALREKLAKIGERLTPEERVFVQTTFVRGIGSLEEVQGYIYYYNFDPNTPGRGQRQGASTMDEFDNIAGGIVSAPFVIAAGSQAVGAAPGVASYITAAAVAY